MESRRLSRTPSPSRIFDKILPCSHGKTPVPPTIPEGIKSVTGILCSRISGSAFSRSSLHPSSKDNQAAPLGGAFSVDKISNSAFAEMKVYPHLVSHRMHRPNNRLLGL